jgi:hypothetical protein
MDRAGVALAAQQQTLALREEFRRENPDELSYARDRDGTRRNLTQVLESLITAGKN